MKKEIYTLSVIDRVILLNILPKEGNMITLLALKGLKESLVFSEFENKALDVRMEGENLFWNKGAEQVKDVEIGGALLAIIVDTFTKMDAEGKLNETMIDVYQQFVT